jgi:hypothetical protein
MTVQTAPHAPAAARGSERVIRPQPLPGGSASWPRGNRLGPVLRESAARINREIRIALTPLKRPEKWVFVVGCYNSGTELLMNVLGSHPGIASQPTEGQFLTDQFYSDYQLGLPRMWTMREDLFRLTEEDPGPDPVRLAKEWTMRLDRSRPVFLEKSPPNAARMRWLQAHFPAAHFICIVRNGYAVAEGIRRKAEPFHMRNGWPLSLCARQWNRSNEIMVEDAGRLDRSLWITYEALAARPADVLGEVFGFLDLPQGPSSVDVGSAWAIHEKEEPIRDMNDESIGRLTQEELRVVTREAEPMLRHFGYELLG